MKSLIEQERLKYRPLLPKCLQNLLRLEILEVKKTAAIGDQDKIQKYFPKTFGRPTLAFRGGASKSRRVLRVGVVLSGGQAAGGHNVIAGVFDALKIMHRESRLFGFLDGPSGIVQNRYIELSENTLADFRNMGGFDLLGSGRAKIETTEQLEAAKKNIQQLSLDGLVIIGGDDSNTNAAILAEYFLTHGCNTRIVGVPKTIDGDLKNESVEISFGFDTACKTYSELIGNIARDALSAKKYYHFIKLMGRSASHIALECALQTHPNFALIGEEVKEKKMTLLQITKHIADGICEREKRGKSYGVVLIPEGLIEFIPEMKLLIQELNSLIMHNQGEEVVNKLSNSAKETFNYLPKEIARQLLLDRDPHGNVQVSHIGTEQLLIHTVREELKKRLDYKGKFNPVNHFFGYEGRSGFPSNFDVNYCNSLGYASAILIDSGYTGYMSIVKHLANPVEEWDVGGIPITMLMNMEERKGKFKPVIQKALVDLKQAPFQSFLSKRDKWILEDAYRFPGPIQLFGPKALSEETTLTLKLEQEVEVVV